MRNIKSGRGGGLGVRFGHSQHQKALPDGDLLFFRFSGLLSPNLALTGLEQKERNRREEGNREDKNSGEGDCLILYFGEKERKTGE